MESLLHYLNKQSSGVYSDKENKLIAEYLTGKTKIENLESFLKPVRYLEHKSAIREIGREVTKEKELLPRLGRFLQLMRKITNINTYFDFVTSVTVGDLTIEEIYAGSELGISALLVDVLEHLSTGHYWQLQSKEFGYDSYSSFFEATHKKYPGAFESLIHKDFGYSVFATVYLYTHDPAKCNDDFADAIVIIGATLINMSKKGNDDVLDAVKAEPRFASSPFIKPLEKRMKKDSSVWGKIDKNFKRPICKLFYFACLLSPSRPEILNLINYILMYIDYKEVFEYIINTRLCLLRLTNSENLYTDCLPLFLEGLYPKDRFLAYFASDNSGKYNDSFYKLVLENEDAALKASKISEGLGNVALMNVFWENGKHLDEIAYYEQRFVKNILGKNNNAVIEDYFLGKNDVAFEKLPTVDLSNYNVIVGTAALLSVVSAVPERVFIYAVKHKQIYWFKRTLESMRNYRGNKATEDFLDALALPVDIKLAILIDTCIETWDDEEKIWLRKQIERISGQRTELLETAFKTASAKGRAFILEMVYKDKIDYKPQWLIECLSDSSKVVRDLAVAYLTPQNQLKEQIEPLVKSKTKVVRECAEKLMISYNTIVTDGSTGESGDFNVLAYCVQNIPSGALRTIAWTEFETLPKVRMDGMETLADDRIVIGYIYLFVTQTEMALPPAAAKIRESLHKEDLRLLGEQLYQIWKKNNAPAKHRGVLVLTAIDCSDAFIRTLKTDIQNWADSSRGALASDAVRAMALQGGNLALMTVDAISKKFSNKQVQRAGEVAFQFAAEQLGVDPEVLGDRIVPNLGFDSRGEQVIDYGSRSFIATINPSLQIELRTVEGKEIKSLPLPGANDDPVKAAAAKETFSTIKKSLKSVASIQGLRLELALSCNRTWTKEEWAKLFVENPIMNIFAIGLIWGVYEANGQLKSSFRYMEDGSFTNVEEDVVVIADDVSIGLCHPLDMGDELITAWAQQLSDYEIKQPVEQLSRTVFRLADDKKNAVAVTEFGGAVMYAVSLLGKLQKLGWSKGSIQDAGGYSNFYKEDKKQGIGAWLNFSGTYVGADTTEEVTVYDILFYKAGTVQYGSYIYDEIKEADRMKLSNVPARLYSEICYDIERATANRIRTEKDWEKTR